MPVILTRPDNHYLSAACQQKGWQTVDFPIFKRSVLPIEPIKTDYDLIVFVNSYAAQVFYQHYQKQFDRPLEHYWQAVVGQTSYSTLKSLGAKDVLAPPKDAQQDSESLFQSLLQSDRFHQLKKVLIVRAKEGRQWLAESLSQYGVQVDFLAVYDREINPVDRSLLEQLRALSHEKEPIVWLVSSAGMATILCDYWQRYQLFSQLDNVLCTHPKFIEQIKKSLPTSVWETEKIKFYETKPQDDEILKTIERIFYKI
ncbi:uroporphyrinogen-III synthase [Basilea psittacipulmonis]|uniref:Tetrapyrrole biosynthesis uroporphyrinogen III synthase domain-containing protein n=1 Tax=Basilea psittacipulmonis DSM 24701 TaxID=1072685 RepID=A0A077DH50_9BURK|nr:uroporphyrinogen-III synthase [Basilea psittacipulmonis]AIL32757.1 hypothetical protein IX83_05040 [Basilea psittacipulmonis DSM 24701]